MHQRSCSTYLISDGDIIAYRPELVKHPCKSKNLEHPSHRLGRPGGTSFARSCNPQHQCGKPLECVPTFEEVLCALGSLASTPTVAGIRRTLTRTRRRAIIAVSLLTQLVSNRSAPMSPMIKQPLTIEYALLGFLRQQPMHAYEIHQTLLRAEAL